MSYESPIELLTEKVTHDVSEETDEMVLEAVYKTEIRVDKEELIKALQYDRNQYEKGYADGVADAQNIIKGKIEWLEQFDPYTSILVSDVIDAFKDCEVEE